MIEAVSSKLVIAPRCLNFCLEMTYEEEKTPWCQFWLSFWLYNRGKIIQIFFYFYFYVSFAKTMQGIIQNYYWWLPKEWNGATTVITGSWITGKYFNLLSNYVVNFCVHIRTSCENLLFKKQSNSPSRLISPHYSPKYFPPTTSIFFL